jgi:hypothetical protein
MNKKIIAAIAAAPAIAFAPLPVATPVAHADSCCSLQCCDATYPPGDQQGKCVAAVAQGHCYG